MYRAMRADLAALDLPVGAALDAGGVTRNTVDPSED